MGRLFDLVESYRDRQDFPPSYRKMAERVGMAPTAFLAWREIKEPPDPWRLLALADMINVPYSRLLDAALEDAGYLPEERVRERAREPLANVVQLVADEEDAPAAPGGGSNRTPFEADLDAARGTGEIANQSEKPTSPVTGYDPDADDD